MPALGLHCFMGFSVVAASRVYSLVAGCRLLIVVAFLVVEHGSRHVSSVVAPGL